MSAAATTLPTRDRILDAAEILFSERGLAGTAVRDIATRVGLNPASLYNHFPSKLALYEVVLERGIHPLLEILREVAQRDDLENGGEQIIDRLMGHLENAPHLARLLHHEAVTGGVHLGRLARVWVKPLAAEAVGILKQKAGSEWAEEDYPLLIAAWIHLIFGHFAMAPLFDEVFDRDTLSRANLARQTHFIRELTLLMLGRHPSQER